MLANASIQELAWPIPFRRLLRPPGAIGTTESRGRRVARWMLANANRERENDRRPV
jgi:hypothetical protein